MVTYEGNDKTEHRENLQAVHIQAGVVRSCRFTCDIHTIASGEPTSNWNSNRQTNAQARSGEPTRGPQMSSSWIYINMHIYM